MKALLKSDLIVLILLVSSLSMGSVRAQSFYINNHRNHINVPFRIVRNMVVVQAYINDKGPFNFILDTGVGLMVITDPELVESVNIIKSRTINLGGWGEGKDLEAYITTPLQIDIRGLRSKDVSAAIFKEDHFGLSNYAGIPICGLLGYEFFSNLVVKINFEDSLLTAYRPKQLKIQKKYTGIPISVEQSKPYLKAQVRYRDSSERSCKLIVDLGAGHPLSLENDEAKIVCATGSISANLGMGINGPSIGKISRVNELDLGQFVLKNVLTSFPDKEMKNVLPVHRDGSLGLDILKRFKLIIDYPDSMIYFKPGYNLKEPFEHDMSGLEYYSGGDEFKRVIIGRVEPGSAAAKIGLEKDDELLSINLVPVTKMTLEDIDHLFRSREGRKLLLEVYRNKKYADVILTLQKRI